MIHEFPFKINGNILSFPKFSPNQYSHFIPDYSLSKNKFPNNLLKLCIRIFLLRGNATQTFKLVLTGYTGSKVHVCSTVFCLTIILQKSDLHRKALATFPYQPAFPACQ